MKKIYIERVVLNVFCKSEKNSDWSWLQAFIANTRVTTTFHFCRPVLVLSILFKRNLCALGGFCAQVIMWEDAKCTNWALPTLVTLIVIIPQSYGPEINYPTATLPFYRQPQKWERKKLKALIEYKFDSQRSTGAVCDIFFPFTQSMFP